jgi:NADH:ubiquinone oxidoreductase subunit F (NADH-binding)
MEPAAIVAAVTASGLRGRGGAAFPTGIKWNTVLKAKAAQKYIVCNADEGDSGTFADRIVMEADPFVLIEGITIAGIAVGATKGYIYVRSEYPHAIAIRRSPLPSRAATSAPTCSAPAVHSSWRYARAPAPTSAAKKPRCSKA